MTKAERLLEIIEPEDNVFDVMNEYCPSYFGMSDDVDEDGVCVGNNCLLCWLKEVKS